MKKKIRALSIILAVAMILVLSACAPSSKGSSTATKNDKYDFGGMTITIASPYKTDLTPGLNSETDALISRIAKVEEQYKVKVEFKMISAGSYWDDMVSVAMGGTPHGDLMFAFPWMLTDWIKGNVVRDVSGIAKEVGIDFNDGTWSKLVMEDNTYGNATFGFTRGYTTLQNGLLFNTKLFKEANLKNPNEIIAEKGKWDFATMEEYARKLTKVDSTGKTTQIGLSTTGLTMLLQSFVLSNGGSIVDYSTEIPTFAMGNSKSLQALEIFNKMLNIDKSITGTIEWQKVMEGMAKGTIAMAMCEEWVISDMKEYIDENGLTSDYALTYFPIGPSGTDYIDTSYGGNSTFIPSTISDEKAKAALLVYAALYAPGENETMEDIVTNRGEAIFADEASVDVFKDIVLNNKAKSTGTCRLGLNEIAGYITESFFFQNWTPPTKNSAIYTGKCGQKSDTT
ncbi:MAG: extracellular solute-binding protein, partial [Oscillospiraceae bacterium]